MTARQRFHLAHKLLRGVHTSKLATTSDPHVIAEVRALAQLVDTLRRVADTSPAARGVPRRVA